jgi:uncharacterized protein YbjQ (UPF0145 family)
LSPLFHRRSPEEKAADAEAAEARAQAAERSAERAAESLARIEQGHIPLAAAERMSGYAPAGAPADGTPAAFSSDLGVSEWSALARLGIAPVTQVMGSSIYNIGWQPTYFNVPTEVRVLSDAHNECRRLALNRLLEEAQLCGADAVLGVRIQDGAHDWAPGSIEFIAVGTAVRLPDQMREAGGGTILSDLTGQEFVMLCEAGLRPVGIAAHTSVHYVPASNQTMMAQGGVGRMIGGMGGSAWSNQELTDFTQGVYEAREKAMTVVTAQARQMGGTGLIGVQVREHGRTHAVNRGMYESKDLQITFQLIGTVIREDPTLAASPPSPAPLQILRLK